MSEPQETLDRTEAKPLHPSASRRHLLKAAASAPVIATLPGTAAFAASIHQCLIDAAAGTTSQDAIDSYVISASDPGTYVRKAAKGFLYRKHQTTGDDLYAYVIRLTDTGILYRQPGQPQTTDTPPDPGDGQAWTQISQTQLFGYVSQGWEKVNQWDINVLVLFNTTGQPPDGLNEVGVWPAQEKVETVAFGTPGSCYCSVDPGAQSSAYCS